MGFSKKALVGVVLLFMLPLNWQAVYASADYLQGHIYDVGTQQPIWGASVLMAFQGGIIGTSQTNEEGHYFIQGPFAPGDYTIIISAPGYATAVSTISVPPDWSGPLAGDFCLLSTIGPGMIKGWVQDFFTSCPIKGAVVTAFDGIEEWDFSSNNLGAYLGELPARTYTIEACADSYNVKRVEGIPVSAANSPVTQNFLLTPTTGACLDLNGDDKLSLADLVIGLQMLAGMQPLSFNGTNRDATGDEKFGMAEIIFMLQKISCLR